jgi:hypothetical protein
MSGLGRPPGVRGRTLRSVPQARPSRDAPHGGRGGRRSGRRARRRSGGAPPCRGAHASRGGGSRGRATVPRVRTAEARAPGSARRRTRSRGVAGSRGSSATLTFPPQCPSSRTCFAPRSIVLQQRGQWPATASCGPEPSLQALATRVACGLRQLALRLRLCAVVLERESAEFPEEDKPPRRDSGPAVRMHARGRPGGRPLAQREGR